MAASKTLEGKTMSKTNDTKNGGPSSPVLGLLIAPIAILMALLANEGLDFGLVFETETMKPFAALGGAAILAITPRVLRELSVVRVSVVVTSLATLVASLAYAEITSILTDSNFLGLLAFITMFGGYILDSRGRHEWNTVLCFSMIGLWMAIVASMNFIDTQTKDYLYTSSEGSQLITMASAHQEASGFVFFNTIAIFTILGLLTAVLARGVLNPASDKGWFGYIKPTSGYWNKKTMPLQIALAIWAFTHVAVMAYFNTLSDQNILGVHFVDGYHGYIGFWPAAITGVVALACAWMAAERWFTRAIFAGSMWILYIVSSLYESGHWANESLEGTWAVWIWFGITFFIGVLIYWFSTHDHYGGWMNREQHEPSQARVFWSNHWAGIMVFVAFMVALSIRIQWYFVPSMNSEGLYSWDLTGGSDPWYMKRVVDYVVANNAHLIFDADRNYPVGGINPRPPLFSWSMALGAMFLTKLGLSADESVWYAMTALPAIFGALIVFPMAGIARDNFGKGAGVIAAWLIAFMPTHVQKSTWAMADHDSYALLFLTAAFMYYLRAVKAGGDERLSRHTNAYPSGIVTAMAQVVREKRKAAANAIAAGVCFSIVALGWKGFVYGPAIIFLAYFVQVAMNMFRRKDSTILSALNLIMLGTIFIMVIPFYAHPQLDLVLNSTGLTPLLFITLFTIAIAWITTGFRDKPWLLVLGSLTTGGVLFGTVLYLLQITEISNAWDILTTGSGYFTKNKIFGTIAEASAPSRGQLFASYGPIVFVLAIVMGIIALWDGLVKKSQTKLILGMWVIIASYMAWSAGRFLFNAAPAMAVMGAWGIVTLWKASGAGNMAKSWRRMGIRTPGERISNARKAVWRTPQFSAIGLVLIMLISQHAAYGMDAAMPSSTRHEAEMDETIYNIAPDILRWNDFGFSILDDTKYDENSRFYLGAFGSGFNDEGWNMAYDWLANQDKDQDYSDRPAFVSWWDYGFQALETGEHPSVSDNFQSGIPATGNMLLARNQDDLVSMFMWRLSEGDLAYNDARTGERQHTSSFLNTLTANGMLDDKQKAEFVKIQTDLSSDDVIDRVFKVIHVSDDVVLAEGKLIQNGTFDTDPRTYYRVYENQQLLPCPDGAACVEDSYLDKTTALDQFKSNAGIGSAVEDIETNTTHYIVGDYWYTSDLIEEFDSVSTGIHRKNAAIALITQLLTSSLETEDLHKLYSSLSSNRIYEVQDYDGAPGETITRDHEIRYFAIDHRLYPRAGTYSSQYSGGNPTGIFAAPTILSGQDFSTFMNEIYMTSRGQFNDEMTREEFDVEMRKDVLNQQSGADFEPLSLVDVRVDHTPEFFETMLARAYVGYGASSLGFATTEQPGQHMRQSGTPNTMMTNALPLPGAMMNHFVIANWYNGEEENLTIQYDTNTMVKILKYYPGAEIQGRVSMSDNGQPLPDVRILLERDAFSGEDDTDNDNRTWWVPIGFTDADENGEWSYIAPAGRIRATAFAGVYNDVETKDIVRSGDYAQSMGDIFEEFNADREINAITALLGNVANMSWMGEVTYNITGAQADYDPEEVPQHFDIEVDSSGISGTVTWTGHESFEGEPLEGVDFILRNIWSMTDNYTVSTTDGLFTTPPGESQELQGTGEVTFTEVGTFDTQGETGIVRGFTGNYTRTVLDGRSYTANASFEGVGEIVATWIDYEAPDCEIEDDEPSLPTYNITGEDNITETLTHVACLTSDSNTYLFQGIINANGRITADGVVTVVKDLNGETFEGTGVYRGTGIANGTGRFVGEGTFTGPMVAPGSFYITGLMPGTYNMIAVMENGREILLPDPVEVSIEARNDVSMNMPGSVIEDILYADYFTDSNPTPLPHTTIEILDFGYSESEYAASIVTDENGSFSYGPLAPGFYQWRVDVDQDDWYEVEANFTVGLDSENITLDMAIPTKTDLTINLSSTDSDFDLSNRTITLTHTEFTGLNQLVVTATSDESGVVYCELAKGRWIISDETNEDFVLWYEVEIADEDLNLELPYAISAWVNGTVYLPREDSMFTELDDPDFDFDNLPTDEFEKQEDVNLEARSGSIILTAKSGENGTYSFRLPENLEFHITATEISAGTSDTYVAGFVVTNATQVDNTDLILRKTLGVTANVYLRNSSEGIPGVSWSDTIIGGSGVEVIATDADGLEWIDSLDSDGSVYMNLISGNYTFTVSNDLMNVSAVDYDLLELGSTVDLVAHPENISLTMRTFLDVNEDNEWENGTAVTPEFVIKSINEYGIDLNVTADMYDNVTGELMVDLSIGTYILEMVSDSPRDENATDYKLYSSGLPTIDIGLGPSGEPIDVIIPPEYLFTGTMMMESGFPMDNSTVWLRNAAGDDFYPLPTDANGTFAEYVPQGDWFLEVDDYQADSNETEILRMNLSIESAQRDLVLQTVTAMEVNIQIQESVTGVNVTATRMTAVSLDGLGNVSLGPSDNEGKISEVLMPGNWTLALSRTDNLEMWELHEGVYNSAESMINGTWEAGVVEVDKSVLAGGKIFWDLDENDIPSSSEGIEGVNVSITSDSGFSEQLVTDENGVWSLFVPIRDNYTVVAQKDGFATVNYTDGNSSYYVVNDTHESRDFEMSAGVVTVTINVTDKLGDTARLESAHITLYPAKGIVRDTVSITDTSYINSTLSWTGEIAPGDWVVIVEDTEAGPNGGGIAVGLLEASVQEGASIDLVMEMGGLLSISTSWVSIDNTAYHAGDVSEGVVVEFDLGDNINWVETFDSNGEIVLIMPAGVVDIDSEFETIQHEMNLTMEYSSGISVDVIQDTAVDKVMEFTRKVNSDMVVEIISVNASTAEFSDEDLTELTAIEEVESDSDEESAGYRVIEMTLELSYEGTEISDKFLASSTISVTQDSEFWLVEYEDEDGNYSENLEITLGIGENNSDENQILSKTVNVRIELPLQNQSQTYDDGHTVNMRFTADGGITESSITVFVPQQYGISMDPLEDRIGIADGGETLVTVRVQNQGNGDDTITVTPTLEQSCLEAGWQVTPPISNLTVAADDDRSQSFTVFASTNSTEGECELSFEASSENSELETESDSIDVSIEEADFEIIKSSIEPDDADAEANTPGVFKIPIKNNGFLAVTGIEVTLSADELGDTVYESVTKVIDVPANGTTFVQFEYDSFPPGPARLLVTIDAGDNQVKDSSQTEVVFTRTFSNMADADDESPLFTIVIVILTLLVLYGGYNTARKGSSGKF